MSEQIKALCIDPKVPDHVKRHFSADCAERAMFAWCEQNGKEPIPQWWVLMEAIRNFAEGRITLEALGEARKPYVAGDWGVDWVSDWGIDSTAYYTAYYAAYWTTYLAAYWAAERAADWAADRETEREWQLQHFHALIEQHNTLKAQLLLVLNRRAAEITHALPQAQQEYEEVLFT